MERIAMMTAWNTDSGVAIHAEPIGKAWIRMGYDLKVFSFVSSQPLHENVFIESELALKQFQNR